jgi:hypothetical protein
MLITMKEQSVTHHPKTGKMGIVTIISNLEMCCNESEVFVQDGVFIITQDGLYIRSLLGNGMYKVSICPFCGHHISTALITLNGTLIQNPGSTHLEGKPEGSTDEGVEEGSAEDPPPPPTVA